ncbi:hypothetical protein IQ07DRAFT_149916 [Pyrenochaeta sp. DS3sAY3a]|nr:hypothetical protein IQ07DRAFT_149916 [Pyrenochaeta sp. DS3sAY3a]
MVDAAFHSSPGLGPRLHFGAPSPCRPNGLLHHLIQHSIACPPPASPTPSHRRLHCCPRPGCQSERERVRDREPLPLPACAAPARHALALIRPANINPHLPPLSASTSALDSRRPASKSGHLLPRPPAALR